MHPNISTPIYPAEHLNPNTQDHCKLSDLFQNGLPMLYRRSAIQPRIHTSSTYSTTGRKLGTVQGQWDVRVSTIAEPTLFFQGQESVLLTMMRINKKSKILFANEIKLTIQFQRLFFDCFRAMNINDHIQLLPGEMTSILCHRSVTPDWTVTDRVMGIPLSFFEWKVP